MMSPVNIVTRVCVPKVTITACGWSSRTACCMPPLNYSKRPPRSPARGEYRLYTLGINAAFHDPAACLVKDGRVIAAAEEERFTHIKHGKRPVPFAAYELPFHAIDFCLHAGGIRLVDV